ncbi:MAG: alkaline phosphatase D family protein [Burkholderiaceae bacterium]
MLGSSWLGSPLVASATRFASAALADEADLFGLGVASGCLGADGVVLWTRLDPAPQHRQGGFGDLSAAGLGEHRPDNSRESLTISDPVVVRWAIASDEAMLHPVASGAVTAAADDGHAVRVEVGHLAPDRWYWYRFAAAGSRSRIGRTRTLPARDARHRRLRIAIASCQNYEHGYYAAYRHLLADEPDLIVHLGDYVYEGTWGKDLVRPLGLPEARTLADYRERYAIYRRDPDLQAAHAAVPWIMVWDDHEVANDYARLTPEWLHDADTFARRRTDAYRAWFEHMPVPQAMAPRDGTTRIHRALTVGDLATIYLLDSRQYRSVQACPRPSRGGGNAVEPASCNALADPSRTMLGVDQENWLASSFGRSRTRWNLIGQQTLMAPLALPGPAATPSRVRTDGWDGYPVARQRLVDSMTRQRLSNPVVIGGDLHAFYVADLAAGPHPDSAIAAAEFVGTSITSQAPGQGYYDRVRAANAHLRYANGTQRGYLRMTVTRDRIEVDLVGLDDSRRADSAARIQSAWVVEDGRPGAWPA